MHNLSLICKNGNVMPHMDAMKGQMQVTVWGNTGNNRAT